MNFPERKFILPRPKVRATTGAGCIILVNNVLNNQETQTINKYLSSVSQDKDDSNHKSFNSPALQNILSRRLGHIMRDCHMSSSFRSCQKSCLVNSRRIDCDTSSFTSDKLHWRFIVHLKTSSCVNRIFTGDEHWIDLKGRQGRVILYPSSFNCGNLPLRSDEASVNTIHGNYVPSQ